MNSHTIPLYQAQDANHLFVSCIHIAHVADQSLCSCLGDQPGHGVAVWRCLCLELPSFYLTMDFYDSLLS